MGFLSLKFILILPIVLILYFEAGKREKSLNMNFEQTDRGIVMTVNAAVSGQGPKFARTAFPVISKHFGTIKGEFSLYSIDAHDMPQTIKDLFVNPQTVPAPFHPFETQYDTYLLKYNDIKQ